MCMSSVRHDQRSSSTEGISPLEKLKQRVRDSETQAKLMRNKQKDLKDQLADRSVQKDLHADLFKLLSSKLHFVQMHDLEIARQEANMQQEMMTKDGLVL